MQQAGKTEETGYSCLDNKHKEGEGFPRDFPA